MHAKGNDEVMALFWQGRRKLEYAPRRLLAGRTNRVISPNAPSLAPTRASPRAFTPLVCGLARAVKDATDADDDRRSDDELATGVPSSLHPVASDHPSPFVALNSCSSASFCKCSDDPTSRIAASAFMYFSRSPMHVFEKS
jgi:hypothetical protein